jgi:hypothetical protein
MFCKVVFVKLNLNSWEDTQLRVFLFLGWKFACPKHLWYPHPLYSERS